MAVKFNEVKRELETSPLSNEEFLIVNKVERYVDKKIKQKFDGGSVIFETKIIGFEGITYGEFNLDCSNIKSSRKILLVNELKRRFEDAGWQWVYQKGEDDGPNRPAISYWELKGK